MLSPELRQRIVRTMVESRCLEERLLKMVRQGLGHFWTGGPGEEAFNVCVGALLNVGRGPDHDFLLPHYRSSAVALMAGVKSIDFLRQMLGRATDPFSRGRNFANHFCDVERNLGPVSSPVNSQFVFGLGTARAQQGRNGITVVIGGDASTQSGDFASLLVWANRPEDPLPILVLVTNNGVGISTSYASQHAEAHIADRARPFGMAAATVSGMRVDETYAALSRAFEHVRTTRRPYLLEAHVTRLWGHSSSSSTAALPGVEDPLAHEVIPESWWADTRARLLSEENQVLAEPHVTPESAELDVFGEGRPWPPLLRR